MVSFQALVGRTSDSGKRKQELADDTEESGVVDVKVMKSDRVARRLSKIMCDQCPIVHRADLRRTLDLNAGQWLAGEARHMHSRI